MSAPAEQQETPPHIHQRYVLLIGVRTYADVNYRELPHTVQDVVELEKVLTKSGYMVQTLHSDQDDEQRRPTRDNIWGKLGNLIAHTGPGDLLLIYFGGHGDLYNGKAYLAASGTYKQSLHRTGVDLEQLHDDLSGAKAQARILVLDACHSGIGRSADGMDPEFDRLVHLEAAGMATLASCRQDQLSYEHDHSRHGVFTYFMPEGLRGAALTAGQRFVTFGDLHAYVTEQVKQWAYRKGVQQVPNVSTRLEGDPPLAEIAPQAAFTPEFLPANPFNETLAIRTPERFIGRTAEMRRLQEMLRGGSVALLGEPKIGKSSLLWQLAPQWPGLVIGPLNCHAFFYPDDFYTELAQALGLEGNRREAIRDALLQCEALILIDEFDSAPDWEFGTRNLQRFRYLCDQNRLLHMITATRTPLRHIFPDSGRGSPVNIRRPHALKMDRSLPAAP